MGTDIDLEIEDDIRSSRKVDQALVEAENIFRENENIFSRFQTSSELSKINSNLDKEIKVSDKMFEVLGFCQKFYEFSKGYFDPRIIDNLETSGYDKDFKSNSLDGTKKSEIQNITGKLPEDMVLNSGKKTVLLKKRIDTSGIVKGFTVDEVSSLFKEKGFRHFRVDAGGDMFASKKELAVDLAINIEGLENVALRLGNEGIATSGITRKKWEAGGKVFHHLVNPKKPEYFSKRLKTVTVIAGNTMEADYLAKSLFLMGRKGGMKFAEKKNIKALFWDSKGEVKMSKAMEESIWA